MRTNPLPCLLAAMLSGAFVELPAATPARPNIIVVLMDDMGYADIGAFGSTTSRTPALDRMAREGTRLTSFYAAPVCSASRAQLMTGCYAPRVSIPGVLSPNSAVGLNPQEHTIAGLLKTQGYTTMCIGKWHLGDQPEFLPTRHGFDHYFGLPYSNDMLRAAADTGKKVVPLMRDDRVLGLLDDGSQDPLVRIYTEEAVQFIRDNRERPFFLYLPHAAVHVPIHPGPEFRGKSPHGRFCDWVEEADWSVGRVLDTLRETRLDANTLVIFTSDNGPWLAHGADAGSAAPLYGGKGSTWEGGMRVPTLAWWPGHVKAGRSTDAVAGTIDLLPTFVSLAGGQVPEDRPIDGADISKLLTGESNESAREAHYYFQGYQLEAVRAGGWKLALGPQNLSMGIKAGGVHTPGVRLYHLDQDIGEAKDVAAQNPERVKKLQTLADRMAASLGGGPQGPGVRPPGRVAHAQPLYPMIETAGKPGAKARGAGK